MTYNHNEILKIDPLYYEHQPCLGVRRNMPVLDLKDDIDKDDLIGNECVFAIGSIFAAILRKKAVENTKGKKELKPIRPHKYRSVFAPRYEKMGKTKGSIYTTVDDNFKLNKDMRISSIADVLASELMVTCGAAYMVQDTALCAKAHGGVLQAKVRDFFLSVLARDKDGNALQVREHRSTRQEKGYRNCIFGIPISVRPSAEEAEWKTWSTAKRKRWFISQRPHPENVHTSYSVSWRIPRRMCS